MLNTMSHKLWLIIHDELMIPKDFTYAQHIGNASLTDFKVSKPETFVDLEPSVWKSVTRVSI